MFTIGNIVMYSAQDICKSLHVTKETAYRILAMPEAQSIKIGRKILVSEDNLRNILNTKKEI